MYRIYLYKTETPFAKMNYLKNIYQKRLFMPDNIRVFLLLA